jgi:hypothetical protein
MVTPPPQTSSKGGEKLYTQEEKQQLLDNFDCEGECCLPDTPAPISTTIKGSQASYEHPLIRRNAH